MRNQISLLLSAFLAVSLLAGCGSDGVPWGDGISPSDVGQSISKERREEIAKKATQATSIPLAEVETYLFRQSELLGEHASYLKDSRSDRITWVEEFYPKSTSRWVEKHFIPDTGGRSFWDSLVPTGGYLVLGRSRGDELAGVEEAVFVQAHGGHESNARGIAIDEAALFAALDRLLDWFGGETFSFRFIAGEDNSYGNAVVARREDQEACVFLAEAGALEASGPTGTSVSVSSGLVKPGYVYSGGELAAVRLRLEYAQLLFYLDVDSSFSQKDLVGAPLVVGSRWFKGDSVSKVRREEITAKATQATSIALTELEANLVRQAEQIEKPGYFLSGGDKQFREYVSYLQDSRSGRIVLAEGFFPVTNSRWEDAHFVADVGNKSLWGSLESSGRCLILGRGRQDGHPGVTESMSVLLDPGGYSALSGPAIDEVALFAALDRLLDWFGGEPFSYRVIAGGGDYGGTYADGSTSAAFGSAVVAHHKDREACVFLGEMGTPLLAGPTLSSALASEGIVRPGYVYSGDELAAVRLRLERARVLPSMPVE